MVSSEGQCARLRIRPLLPCPAFPLSHTHSQWLRRRWEWDENSHGGAERGGRAGLRRRVYPQQAHEEGNKHPLKTQRNPNACVRDPQPLFDFHRANWSIWSSGEDGRPSKCELKHILHLLCCLQYGQRVCVCSRWSSSVPVWCSLTHGARKTSFSVNLEKEKQWKQQQQRVAPVSFASTRELVHRSLSR